MKQKNLKCILCGGRIAYEELSQNFKCSECNANISSDMFKAGKKARTRYRLTKVSILVAILGTLYVLYFFLRRML